MYARLITAEVLPGKMKEFQKTFSEGLLPQIAGEPGFKGIYVLNDTEKTQVVALVLWETEANAVASIDHMLRDRLPRLAGVLAD